MAGAGYKLFNTGDVLTAAQVNTYLMEQTVMVFADAAARTTALTGVVSEGMLSYLKSTKQVEVYNGSAWVASDDPNAIQNTIVDAKGDLITATANDVPARLAVGNNGETLVADSSTSTGLRYIPATVMTNPIINGAFDIWQRGTSFSGTAGYLADRWDFGGTPTNYTVSRQATGDTTNLPFIQFAARVQRNSGSTNTNTMYLAQSIESANAIPFAGRTVTLSFYARRGANYSTASNLLGVEFYSGTGTDQNVNISYTGIAAVVSSNATLTTSWQRFTYTGNVAATATELAVRFSNTGVGTAGANDWYEFTGVQIDVGNVALPFRRNGATLAGELAACQRYYWRLNAGNTANFTLGQAYTTTNALGHFDFPVKMRTAPTALEQTGTAANYGLSTSNLTFNDCTSVPLFNNATTETSTIVFIATGLAAGNATHFVSKNNASYLAWSAEL